MSFDPINTHLPLHHFNSPSPPPPPPPPQPPSQHLNSNGPPFDSSMALTLLILLSALFFMGFFSIYIRRFSTEPATGFNGRPPRASTVGLLRHQGLSPEVIRSLPEHSYYRGEAKYQMECSICLGEFEEKEVVKMIPYCKHVFHLECIETWLKMHVTCPVCRGTQLLAENTAGGGGGAPAGRVDEGGNEEDRRSAVENDYTCIEVGEVSLVRSGSCSS